MKLVKVLKLLICFVLIVPLFATNASANTNYDHDELMQYEGYGKAMYESIVEQTTFVSGQYTDNKEFVNDSIDQVKDYADFWYNEYDDFTSSCYQNSTMNCLGEMVERGGAYVLTVGDWIKNLFSDYDESVNSQEGLQDSTLLPYFHKASGNSHRISDGFVFRLDSDVTSQYYTYFLFDIGNVNTSTQTFSVTLRGPDGLSKIFGEFPASSRSQMVSYAAETGTALSLLESKYNIKIYASGSLTPLDLTRPDFKPPNQSLRDIYNHINENGMPDVVVPNLKPQLVCPDGTKISMNISGSTFLSVNDEVMMVDKDGTAQINGQLCNLNWQKPEVKYLDDKVVVQDLNDPDGNFEDVLCLLGPANCKPISKEEVAVEKVDKSLLQYVKNAYEYGTGVLKTATDGLKSLATGAKDLTSLFGTFFGWLPNEMVVLMASGLGITVGLRLFRK